jgi:hypothetical protein
MQRYNGTGGEDKMELRMRWKSMYDKTVKTLNRDRGLNDEARRRGR